MMNKLNYDKLKQHKLLVWYDGPILQTLIDPDTNELYIEYDPCPESYLAKTSPEDLIKVLKGEEQVNYCFTNGSKKWSWNPNLRTYEEVSEFGPTDLLNEGTYMKDILGEYESGYIAKLELLVK